YFWLSISSRRRCYSDRFRGPSSHICFSSPQQLCRNAWPRRTERGPTCRLPPRPPKFTAASSTSPDIISLPTSIFDRKEEDHAHVCLHDELRRLRTLRRYLPVRHHAHRQHLPPRLQHRAQHVLGVLLVRQGMPAKCDRLPRLRRLRPYGSQRSGSEGA